MSMLGARWMLWHITSCLNWSKRSAVHRGKALCKQNCMETMLWNEQPALVIPNWGCWTESPADLVLTLQYTVMSCRWTTPHMVNFLSHRATPSSHPFRTMGFPPKKSTSYRGSPMASWKPPYVTRWCSHKTSFGGFGDFPATELRLPVRQPKSHTKATPNP